jgi:1-acyl-sn-glycerol-3-phosphate acyltransferase
MTGVLAAVCMRTRHTRAMADDAPKTDVKIRETNYKDDRPAEAFAHVHEHIRAHRPGWTYEATRIATVWLALTVYRLQAFGAENVPNGPLIVAPNHASFLDHFFAGASIRRHIQFMAKSQLFNNPISTYIYKHGGTYPVRRGYADEEAFKTSFEILGRGGAIGMYCEGSRSRNGKVGAEAKSGIGRLAIESGAAVVPVAILGSHQVRNFKRFEFPKIIVRYGEPLQFPQMDDPPRELQQQAADEILRRIRAMHAELEAAPPGQAAAVAKAAVTAEK